MTDTATKMPVKVVEKKADERQVDTWRPLESLRREIDRLFEDFDNGFWRAPFRRSVFDVQPFWQRELSWSGAPAVDIVEKDAAYELTADVPGFDEKNIEVKLSDGALVIKGQKQDEREEKKKGFYLQERHSGSFERYFRIPEGVDPDKIEATFKKGVLTLTMPKKPEAIKPTKKIEVKAA